MKEDLDAFINKLTDGEGVNVIFEPQAFPHCWHMQPASFLPQAVWWL